MEPYPYHYNRRPRSDDVINPNFHLMLDEMQHTEACLSERSNGHCSGLEQRVVDVENRFISLEMSCTEATAKRIEMDKLEVERVNRFLKHESLASPHSKPGIISTTKSVPAPPPSSTITDGLDGHRVANHHQDRESGSVDTHPHILVNDMNQTSSLVTEHSHRLGHCIDSIHASQGRLPILQFPVFSGVDSQLWHSRCENYFDMYGVE
jgi:hypothetical protein